MVHCHFQRFQIFRLIYFYIHQLPIFIVSCVSVVCRCKPTERPKRIPNEGTILIEFIILFVFSLSSIIFFFVVVANNDVTMCELPENVNRLWNLEDSFITDVGLKRDTVRINWWPSIRLSFLVVYIFFFLYLVSSTRYRRHTHIYWALFCGRLAFYLSIKPHIGYVCVTFGTPAHNLCSQNISFRLLSINFSTYVNAHIRIVLGAGISGDRQNATHTHNTMCFSAWD